MMFTQVWYLDQRAVYIQQLPQIDFLKDNYVILMVSCFVIYVLHENVIGNEQPAMLIHYQGLDKHKHVNNVTPKKSVFKITF